MPCVHSNVARQQDARGPQHLRVNLLDCTPHTYSWFGGKRVLLCTLKAEHATSKDPPPTLLIPWTVVGGCSLGVAQLT